MLQALFKLHLILNLNLNQMLQALFKLHLILNLSLNQMCQAISSEPVPQLAVGAPDAPLLAPQPRHHRPLPQQAGCCNPGHIFDTERVTSATPF